ncbi:hypothetical protein M407DRAFT_243412 [Tulasnella calospora MUT 4182]|uniref:ESCRT-II complex vps25 subunit n=1 Tax=Tulasnella calospora MUT 4182 TaxID=1051891 RepID=A0A0C3QJL9_9AGAM|nr:hypothetical protein M407DRAFT_243412 [Tulasnella calospora MUT 4182]
MPYEPFTTESGFVLQPIHSFPPFFTKQHHPSILSDATQQWIKLILGYARHRRLWTLRVEDAESKDGPWNEVFWNPRIKRQMPQQYLEYITKTMVSEGSAFWEPPRQTRSVIVCWSKVDAWAETLYDWVLSTGQMNTILTYYEIQNPETVEGPMSETPLPLLLKAIQVLAKSGRAQQIEGEAADGAEGGGGVRFFRAVAK